MSNVIRLCIGERGGSVNNNVASGCLEFEQSEESSYSCADNFLGLAETLKDKIWGKYEDQFADFGGEGKSIDYEYDEFEDYEHWDTDDCEKDIPVEPSHLDLKLIHESEELSFRFEKKSEDANGVGEYALYEWDSSTTNTQISGAFYNLDDISELIKHLTKQGSARPSPATSNSGFLLFLSQTKFDISISCDGIAKLTDPEFM